MFSSRLFTRVSGSGGCSSLRFPLRRAFIPPNNIHRSIFKRHHLLSLLGIVGVGTAISLSVPVSAICGPRSNVNKTQEGPEIKIYRHVADAKWDDCKWKYVILGCGTAAWAAARAISQNEPTAEILLVSAQDEIPAHRDIKIRNEDFRVSYTQWRRHVTGSVPTHYGGKVSVLTKLSVLTGHGEYFVDTEENTVLFADGSKVEYEKLCIASTGNARDYNIKEKSDGPGEDVSSSHRLNKLRDMAAFEELQEELDIIDPKTKSLLHKDVAVVGGGFLGTEIALGCLAEGRKVMQLFPEECVLDRYVPTYLAMHTRSLLTKIGVVTVPRSVVKNVALERRRSIDLGEEGGIRHNRVKVNLLGSSNPLLAHYVALASTHIDPDVRNARASGFEIDSNSGGISVNRHLEVMEGIFCAGNSASWYDQTLGRRRVSRYDHAKKSGFVAGHNMSCSSKKKDYNFQPGFQSCLRKLGVDVFGIGLIDSNYKTVGVWCSNVNEADPNTSALRQGIVYYINEFEDQPDEIVGCLLWNTDKFVNEARQLLASKESRSVKSLIDLKTRINLGEPQTLNIMVEKKNVLSVKSISMKIAAKAKDPEEKRLRY